MARILLKVTCGKSSPTIQTGVSLDPKPSPTTEKDVFLKSNSFKNVLIIKKQTPGLM